MKVACTQSTTCHMRSCPHHQAHERSDMCIKGYCSHQSRTVECVQEIYNPWKSKTSKKEEESTLE